MKDCVETWRFSFTVPNAPRGFTVAVQSDLQHRINLQNTLAVAVEAMYRLTLLPWEGALRQNYHIRSSDIAEEIFFEPTTPRYAEEQMENQHMVYALFAGCLSLTSHGSDSGYEILAVMNLRGQQLGLLHIWTQRTAALSEAKYDHINGFTQLSNGTVSAASGNVSRSSISILAATSDSGTLQDPDDLDFKIHYQFTDRPQTRDPREIFLAALDALANAAPYDADHRLQKLTGTDARSARNAVLVVEGSTRPGPRRHPFTYHFATKTVQLLMQAMTLLNRFQTIQFELKYQGVRFGEGFITRPRIFEDETETAGVARCIRQPC